MLGCSISSQRSSVGPAQQQWDLVECAPEVKLAAEFGAMDLTEASRV
jgi:hypothetical protein